MSTSADIRDILTDGMVSATCDWQIEDFAIHGKGFEPSGHDPWLPKGMGLTFVTSPGGSLPFANYNFARIWT